MSGKSKISDISKIFLVWLVAFFLIIPYASADQYQNSSIKVSVDLVEPYAIVDVSPGEINLGEITKGYATGYQNITFTNKGSLDVNLIPVLENSSNTIFNYLEFNTASCSPTSTVWHNMSYYRTNPILSLDRPDTYRGTNQDNACIRLNLEKYTNTIPSSISGLSENVIIWIMPA